ncbi:hypothetical protein QTN25_000540 [Entamoeba marina]
MNVVLYFKRIRDVREFSIVSKNCHEAIKGLKINPIMNYAKKLKYRKVYASLMFRLFPNIQTIQIPDYSYPIPNEIVSKLSFIRLLNKMNLTEGRIRKNKKENEPPTFKVTNSKYFYYNIHEKFMLKNQPIDTTNQSYYHSLGNEIHTELNDEIISKLQEYEIYSYETVMFFVEHHNIFKSLKSLYIVIDREIKTKNTIENEYNLLIFAILSRIKTLKNIYIHSCKAIINNDYINYIESYPFIKFAFIMYSFIENQNEIYIKLNSMFNVQLIFHCFHPLLLSNGFLVSPNIKMKKITSSILKLLCSQFINLNHYPESIEINHFEMNSKLDLKEIELLKIEIYFFIDDDIIDPLETPRLQLHNCYLDTLVLVGFKYKVVEHLTMMNFPNYFRLNECENIEIQCTSNKIDETTIPIKAISLCDTRNIIIKSIDQYSISKIEMEYCEHITIQTLTQQIQNENEIIIDNIHDVRISDSNIINYTFSNISCLELNTINHLSAIQLPTTLKSLKFQEIPNVNNIQIPNISQNHHLITSLQHISLTSIYIQNIQHTEDMLTITIPTTIKTIRIENCSNVLIQSEEDINIDNIYSTRNINCKFHNISVINTIYLRVFNDLRGTGIKCYNVEASEEFYFSGYTQAQIEDELEGVTKISCLTKLVDVMKNTLNQSEKEVNTTEVEQVKELLEKYDIVLKDDIDEKDLILKYESFYGQLKEFIFNKKEEIVNVEVMINNLSGLAYGSQFANILNKKKENTNQIIDCGNRIVERIREIETTIYNNRIKDLNNMKVERLHELKQVKVQQQIDVNDNEMNIIINSINLLKQWSNQNTYNIIFDSKIDGDGWTDNILHDRVFNRSNVYFITFDTNNNVFGCFITKKIDKSCSYKSEERKKTTYYGITQTHHDTLLEKFFNKEEIDKPIEYIRDENAFVFSLIRDGKVKNTKYLLKYYSNHSVFRLHTNDNRCRLYQLNTDINVNRIGDKMSWCQFSDYDYNEEQHPLIDIPNGTNNYFEAKRIIVMQMNLF